MKYLQIKTFDKYLENPFIEKTVQEFSTRSKRVIAGDPNRVIMARDTGEITGHVAFINYIQVDEEKFTKLFTAELKVLFNLSGNAIKVFAYILSILKPNQDRIVIRIDECKEYTGYKSESAVRTGIATLVKNSFIARTKYNDEYYINPMLFFNGNRVSFVKQYIKKEEPKISDIEPKQEYLGLPQTTESLTDIEMKEKKRRAAILLGKTEEELEEWLKQRK